MKILLPIVLLTVACHTNQNCEADTAFKKQFDEKINFLIFTESEGSGVYETSDKIKTIHFLESVTGTKSQIYWGDVFSYMDQASFNEDLTKWRKWYDNNKCEMTMAKADSLFKNYKK